VAPNSAGADPRQRDVLVARIASVSDQMRARRQFYERLLGCRHPTVLLLGAESRHGTDGREAFVNLINVSPIAKNAILRRAGSSSRTRCVRSPIG
jgi:hypothetical protein